MVTSPRNWSADIKINTGTLTKHGYHISNTIRSRHIALNRAIREYGHRKIIAKLTYSANVNSRLHPARTRIYREDQQWVSAAYKKL